MATNGMTINGLNPLSALTEDDKIPVWDTGASVEPTKEITAQNMANSVKSLASLPNTTEMNAAIAQSTATSNNSYTLSNGANIRCYRSGNVVTVKVTGIGSIESLPQGAAFEFDTGMDEKYKPPFNVSAYGSKRSNYSGTDAIQYSLTSGGKITGYAYDAPVTNGSFYVTFVK